MVCSTGFAVISCNTGQLDSQFLYAYLFSEKLNTDIQNLLAGSSYPAINASDVTGLAIALPPIREQQAIATILSAADVEIAALERKLTALKDQKRFLLNTLVTGSLRLPEFRIEN
jgi:type I restriction enzyme S subunit